MVATSQISIALSIQVWNHKNWERPAGLSLFVYYDFLDFLGGVFLPRLWVGFPLVRGLLLPWRWAGADVFLLWWDAFLPAEDCV